MADEPLFIDGSDGSVLIRSSRHQYTDDEPRCRDCEHFKVDPANVNEHGGVCGVHKHYTLGGMAVAIALPDLNEQGDPGVPCRVFNPRRCPDG